MLGLGTELSLINGNQHCDLLCSHLAKELFKHDTRAGTFFQLLSSGVVYHSFVFDGLLCFSVSWYTFLIFAVVYDRRSWSSAAIH
jgi:hypothetical protein